MSDPLIKPPSIFHLDELFNNPLFAGGVGLAGLGAAAAIAKPPSVERSS
jgi:chaperone BCS1